MIELFVICMLAAPPLIVLAFAVWALIDSVTRP